ncbi:MAG TPA: HIRAN domain-containing protein [Sphingomonas sp.]|jgi:hypothetical protein|uniref:HIRAN domain-containing protein n=1 Tax=Sphingomonas sp. TaxID=28214 RepID=UPI002ED9C82F
MGANDRSLNIVGESFKNTDGGSRQAEIKRCRPGERVELVREPGNKHDEMAIAVLSARGIQIGYIASDHAAWLAPKLDRGDRVPAIVERINGGEPGKPSLGVCIRVNWRGEEVKKPGRRGLLARLFGSD